MKRAMLLLLTTGAVVIAILVVRGVENRQRVSAYNSQREAYCQRYYANQAAQTAAQAAGRVSTVGDMLNLYGC